MNDEQKDFNIENDVSNTETFSLDTNMEPKVPNYTDDSSVNSFAYTEFPSATNVEVSTGESNSIVEPVKNDYNYATPQSSNTSYAEMQPVDNSMEDSTLNSFSYVEPNEITQESVPDVSYQNNDVSTAKSSVVSNYSQMNFSQSHSVPNKKDSKNNFTFMIIFGIIMLAIIIALPYIAGYK